MVSLGEAGSALAARFLPALKHRDYRRLWFATISSQSSAWALIVARGALAKSLTDSDMWVGFVTFAAMIPSVVVSPLAGYLADRFDRRTVLAWAYAVNLANNLLLAILVVTGMIGEQQVWLLVVLSFVTGCARSTQMPSSQALLANTVPRENLFNAVALYQTTQQGSRFVGPMMVLIMLWISAPWIVKNQDWVFFLPTALYIFGLALILTIRTRSRGSVEKGASTKVMFQNIGAGLSYIYRHKVVFSLVMLVVAHCGMTMSFESLFPAISTDKLGLDPGSGVLTGFGFLMVGYGGGGFLTSLALAGVQTESTRGRLFLFLGITSGIAPIALAFSPNLPLAMICVAAMGASASGFMTLAHGMLQAMVPDAIRGRLMGVYSWHAQGMMASFNLVNGTLAAATALTAPLVLGVGGAAFMWVVMASWIRVPLREIYTKGAASSTPTAA